MEPRIDYTKVSRGAFKAMFGLGQYLRSSGFPEGLLNLVNLRVSQFIGKTNAMISSELSANHGTAPNPWPTKTRASEP
jgi:hypothetical protein